MKLHTRACSCISTCAPTSLVCILTFVPQGSIGYTVAPVNPVSTVTNGIPLGCLGYPFANGTVIAAGSAVPGTTLTCPAQPSSANGGMMFDIGAPLSLGRSSFLLRRR